MAEVGDPHHGFADQARDLPHLLVRELEELGQEAELVHHFEGRGMNRVAAEIAQEVAMLFHHHDLDAGAREEISEHHPGRPAAGDGASGVDRLQLSSPVGTFLFSLSSFMPEASAMVSIKAAKSCCR